MKKLKRLSAFICAAVIIAGLVSCSSNGADTSSASAASSAVSDIPKSKVNLAVLKGPTGIGMINLLDASDNGKALNNYEYTISSTTDEITAKLIQGVYDIATVPTNIAASLYNATDGKIKILALNTLGVLYLLENGKEINSVDDLKGKTIYASGQAEMPEYVLNYILESNGINPEKDVNIKYVAQQSELETLASSGKATLCVLPEPDVTTVLTQSKELRVALNLTDEWEKAAKKNKKEGSVLSMGCVVVRSEFADNNKDAVDAFLKEYEESINKVNSDIDAAAALCEKYEIVTKSEIAKNVIPRCNIVFISGEKMKEQIGNFYDVLYNANKKSVGGALPNEAFYYISK